jgi:ribosome-interacting GTPase 1
MKQKTKGIHINGKQIHSIRFADDIAILADSEKDMNNMLQILEKVLSKYKLRINKAKTKVMKICNRITSVWVP